MISGLVGDCVEIERREDEMVAVVNAVSLLDESILRDVDGQLKRLIVQDETGTLLLDFRHVESFGSLCLSKLISLGRELRQAGGRLVLCNLSPWLSDVLSDAKLDSVFEIRQTTFHESETQHKTGQENQSRPTGKQRVVVVCDRDPEVLDALSAKLSWHHDGFHVVHVPDDAQLANCCREYGCSIVALRLFPDPDNGTSGKTDCNPADNRNVPQLLRNRGPDVVVIAYEHLGVVPADLHCQLLDAGVDRVLDRASATFLEDLIDAVIQAAVAQDDSVTERERLFARFAELGIVGRTAAMRDVFQRAVRASQFNGMPVLLTGETGTGKQRLAEAIHTLDQQRRNRPCLTVNCGAVHSHLAESELFGHVRGAFTGADCDRTGIFRAAEGGTIILDEIGDLDPELQPKLLRVLQERRLLPVGADYEHSVDVRIIAATNRPLPGMLADGRFRRDLFQRLNVFPIHIPPLRERPDDIGVQARYFLKHYAVGRQQPAAEFSPRALEVLRLVPWEGNSRELENVVRETLAGGATGPIIELEDLPPRVIRMVGRRSGVTGLVATPTPARKGEPTVEETGSAQHLLQSLLEGQFPLLKGLQQLERHLIETGLRRNNGNRTRTALELGVSRQVLQHKMKKHGLA